MLVLTGPTYLFRILQVPLCSPATVVAMTMTTGLSSSSPERMEPRPKKAHLGAFLRVSS
jgi:hypothetical protein